MRGAGVGGIVNACGAGRGGTPIFRFVYHVAGFNRPFFSLWISGLEDEAIGKGFGKAKTGKNGALLHSPPCRAKADWMTGIHAGAAFLRTASPHDARGAYADPGAGKACRPRRANIRPQKGNYHIASLDAGGEKAASRRISRAAQADRLKTAAKHRGYHSAAKAADTKLKRQGTRPGRGRKRAAKLSFNHGSLLSRLTS